MPFAVLQQSLQSAGLSSKTPVSYFAPAPCVIQLPLAYPGVQNVEQCSDQQHLGVTNCTRLSKCSPCTYIQVMNGYTVRCQQQCDSFRQWPECATPYWNVNLIVLEPLQLLVHLLQLIIHLFNLAPSRPLLLNALLSLTLQSVLFYCKVVQFSLLRGQGVRYGWRIVAQGRGVTLHPSSTHAHCYTTTLSVHIVQFLLQIPLLPAHLPAPDLSPISTGCSVGGKGTTQWHTIAAVCPAM